MSKLTKFLKDDAIVVGDIATNTAGASGDTSQSIKKEKKVSNLLTRLSENTIKFRVTHENGVVKLMDLQEKYPDAVFTYNVSYDILGDMSGDGIIEVSDIWYNDIKDNLKDNKWFDLFN